VNNVWLYIMYDIMLS